MSSARRRESTATLFWLLALVLVVAGVWWYLETHPLTEEEQAQPPNPRPADAQEVTVRFLQDGDSLGVTALAPGRWLPTTDEAQIRLLGVDAPEMHGADGLPQCWAEQAKAELLKLAPFGGRIWVVGDTQAQDKFGRYLVYAWTPDGRFVNEQLAAAGAVRELTIAPNHAYEQQLHNRIAGARAAGAGLWGTCIS